MTNGQEFVNVLVQMNDIRERAGRVSPDEFVKVAKALYGLTERPAYQLHRLYREAVAKGLPYWMKPEEAVPLLTKAHVIASHCIDFYEHRLSCGKSPEFIGTSSDDNEREYFCVFFRRGEGEPYDRIELSMTDSTDWELMHQMRLQGVEFKAIVRQCTEIYDTGELRKCLNEGYVSDNGERTKRMRIYEGDIFVTYNEYANERNNIWSDRGNGVFVARWDGYRQLLYTRGRGYVKADDCGEPNYATTQCDEEYNEEYLSYDDDHRYSHHKLTLGHSWERVGNIFCDISMLREKKQEKKEC